MGTVHTTAAARKTFRQKCLQEQEVQRNSLDAAPPRPKEPLDKYTRKQLQEFLKARGSRLGGNNPTLVARLREAMEGEPSSLTGPVKSQLRAYNPKELCGFLKDKGLLVPD